MKRPVSFFCLTLVFLFSFAMFFHPTKEFSEDLGRHIKMGEIILQTHSIPKTNLFSYTYPDFPFINHHWFSEVIFYLIFTAFQTTGLIFITSFVGGLSFMLLASVTMRKYPIATILTTFLYQYILITRTLVRPEIFSLLFLSLFTVILYKNREKETKWIFLLPFVQLLWVNMHIYFPIGVGLVGAFFLEALVPFGRKFTHSSTIPTKQTISYARGLGIILVTSAAATLCNPNGITGALYPFNVLSNYGMRVIENTSLFFDFSYGFWPQWFNVFIACSILLILLLIIFRKKTKLADWIIAAVFIASGVMMIRNFLVFAGATFIPFSLLVGYLFAKLQKMWKKILHVEILVLVVLGLWLIITEGTLIGYGATVIPGPQKGANFLISHKLHGPIFNNFDIGSYLDYRLYPKEKVFVDGRPEAYPVSFFQKIYIPMQLVPAKFSEENALYHFNTIFFAHTDITPWGQRFFQEIMQDKTWKVIYLDETVVILVRNIKENSNLQQITDVNFSISSISPQVGPDHILQFAYRLGQIQWNQAEQQVLQEVLAENPSSCPALYELAQLLHRQGNGDVADIYAGKYVNECK